MSEQKKRNILTPCPPKKRCPICEARLNEVFGSADHTAKYAHQAAEAGQATINVLRGGLLSNLSSEVAVRLAIRAASYANLVLGPV